MKASLFYFEKDKASTAVKALLVTVVVVSFFRKLTILKHKFGKK